MGFLFLVCLPGYLICYYVFGLSVATSVSINVALLGLVATFYDISGGQKAKQMLKSDCTCKARLGRMDEIKGDRGRNSYLFDIRLDGTKTYVVEKKKFHGKKELGEWFEAYPVFGNKNEVIDFYTKEELLIRRKPFIACYIFTIIMIAASGLLIYLEGSQMIKSLNDIVAGIVLLAFFIAFGTYLMREYIISKKPNVRTVSAKVVGYERRVRRDDYEGELPSKPYPILEVELDGEKHRFISEIEVGKHDARAHEGADIEIYYDEETKEFFEKKNQTGKLAAAMFMYGFAFVIVVLFIKENF